MTRKKWTGGEPVLSVETEDEFHQALPLGLPVEVTPAIAEGIGLMAEDVSTLEEIIAAQERRLYAPANAKAKRPDRRVLGEMAALKLASASSPKSSVSRSFARQLPERNFQGRRPRQRPPSRPPI